MSGHGLLIPLTVRVTDENEFGYRGILEHRLLVMVSKQREGDGKMWLHASVSRLDKKMPKYQDLKRLKEACIGDHQTAYQVFPPAEKHVDYAGPAFGTEVLHLWCCLDGPVTPDFLREKNGVVGV